MKVRILKHIPMWPQPGLVIDIPPAVARPHIRAGNIAPVGEISEKPPKEKKRGKKKKIRFDRSDTGDVSSGDGGSPGDG